MALDQISLITTFAKAHWESFMELNLFGNAIVLPKEEKKIRAYKMNIVERYSQLSLMKPRCKEL